MSLNVRRRMRLTPWRRADRWDVRAPRLRRLLRSESPHILGLQEVLPDQQAFIAASLDDRYRSIGEGRGVGGAGERCPVFYDADRLELREWEQRALSETPGVAGSVSWGNLLPRIAVLAEFRDRDTGASLRFINTHFDHLSRRSRLRSAQAVREWVGEQPLPAVVTGDLNTSGGTRPVQELLAGGELVDAWRAAETRTTPAWGTFADYRAPKRGGRRIDWILVTPDIRVSSAAVDARQYLGGWPSDHLPVHVVVHLPGDGTAA